MITDCANGVCSSIQTPGCTPCTTDGDCSDGNGCTNETCVDNVCERTTLAGCISCTTAAECSDNNPCTDDLCTGTQVCANTPVAGCITCTTDDDCDDQNACTLGHCAASGSCEITTLPGCVPCSSAAECSDNNDCTDDACTSGACTHTTIPECPACVPTVEVCSDGLDNDCDEIVDCEDPNCSASPSCEQPAEICGDCRDNDDDGLVDFEDADCCAAPLTLRLKGVRLAPTDVTVRKDRLKLTTVYAPSIPPIFDPMARDTSVQISDTHGQLFCASVPARHWTRSGRRMIRFRDKRGAFAGGLSQGRFTLMRDGSVQFMTRGRNAQIQPTDGQNVSITIGVGRTCSQATASLFTHKTGLVFP
jgi:hypothetical protein